MHCDNKDDMFTTITKPTCRFHSMGGRGRGRGPALSFSTESLGIQRGDNVFQGQLTLTPTFPPLINKPVKLQTDEFVINNSMELRNFFRCVHKLFQFKLSVQGEEFPWILDLSVNLQRARRVKLNYSAFLQF